MRAQTALVVAAVVVLTGCATTGATFGSGVGDTYLEHPPWYAGTPSAAAAGALRIGHFPIAFQNGAAQQSVFDPANGPGTAVAALLGDMNDWLDSLASATAMSVRLAGEGDSAMVQRPAALVPPDVRFGCRTASGVPGEECEERDADRVLGREHQQMLLAVGRPSAAWISWMRDVTEGAGVDRTLVLTLEVGQYLPRQTGWRGDKQVELGTGNVQSLPWLTSLETPVLVLQLTGALVDRDGQVIRIGAEGISVRRTRMLVSAMGGQELLSETDVEAARTLRRDDLAGSPLAWRVALEQLLNGITGGGRLVETSLTSDSRQRP